MKKINKCYPVFILFVFLVSACALKDNSSEEFNPIIPPIYTPANEFSAQVFENVIYDANYLKDCKLHAPPVYSEQIGFHGVYPGKTTVADALEKFGKFHEHNEYETGREFYSYDTFNFSAQDNIIEDIVTDPDTEATLSLVDILEKYGCPDLIIASALSDDPFATSLTYNHTFFFYSSGGLGIGFYSYPIKYSSPAIEAIFSKPMPAKTYLENISDSLASKLSVLVSFEEAVVGE